MPETYDNLPASVRNYLHRFNQCLNYTNNTNHPKQYMQHTQEELFGLTPEHIYAYIAFKCYGTPNPVVDQDFPLNGRSTSAAFIKKSISYFIPNKNLGWNERTREGNPTRSVLVNDLIKKMKKQEVRKQGKEPQARRALHPTEFVEFIARLRSSPQSKKRYAAAAFFIFQYNMIGRVDDVARFPMEDLTPCPEFNFCLQSKMCWSKNVNEERDAPNQLLMGCDNPMYCILIAIAIHLEHGFRSGEIDIGSGLCFPLLNQTA